MFLIRLKQTFTVAEQCFNVLFYFLFVVAFLYILDGSRYVATAFVHCCDF